MHPLSIVVRHPRQTAAAATGAAAVIALAAYAIFRKRPTAEEIEALRRDRLAAAGRISDGSLLDAFPSLDEPHVLVYTYRIAGVTYECSQDVSLFADRIHGPRAESALLDLPIQVRYDRANPADSIVIADTWNGLWSVETDLTSHPDE
ncbi:hypothetical protein [Granulicella tundricola]|uniref:Uncharacterized protein n=1 Tax=Granulicella tundricola (strain ATCC BAA-1859 / DSM 23138 / MP5ACTX9) TaxID=1198114 RepID=E8WXE3_GRATM|nr:hypothetical protein [Granulicella tundricola]ADW67476.1 hypothetical protein AciX9_0404 [Granulicella tundricola MP5ACTX9]